ncbi:MAG: hypothetical protein ACRYG2_05975 [Janthinobacterium lividum]
MSTPRGPEPSPYVVGPRSSRAELSWGRMLARVVLVVVPGQLLGVVLSGLVIPFQVLAAHPGLGWLTYVFVAVVAGLGLGLVLRPTRERLVAHAVLSVVVGAVVLTIFLALGHARTTSSGGRSLLADVLPGVPVAALLQTALAYVLWRRRGARPATA